MRPLTLLLFILLGFDLPAQSDSWEMVFDDDVFNVVITENNSFLNTRTSVYRSIDGGTEWNECNWPLGIVRSGTSTHPGLCFDGSRLIVAALDNGYWISTDLGNSFTQTGPTGFGCASISLLPLSDGSVMGTMGGFQRGLWKVPPPPSTSWTRNFQHSGDQGDLQFGQNNNIYCTSYSNNHTGGILESTDNGNSWTWVFNTSYASNPNSFVINEYELTYFNYLGELVSLDMTNWSITQSIQTPWTNSEGSLILDETGTLFLSNSSGIFSSTDGGQNWDDLTPNSFANTTTYNLKHYENAIYACTSDGLLKLELSTSGCMDPTACNYDANATVDDGSCEAPCNYIVPSYIPEDGLIAWLPFNGNAADESGNGHDGDVDGAILSTDRFDNAESAYFFDGDDRIFPADPTDFPLTERTTSIWMKSQVPVSGGRALLGYGGTGCGSSWLLTYNNQGNQPTALNAFEIQGHCNAFAVAAPLSPSEFQEWHQVVVRTSAAGTDIFIDGLLEAHSSTYVNNTGPGCAVIGAPPSTTGACYYQDASNALWHGWLDDVGIWNRALTDDEILTSFLAGTPVHGCTDEAACNYDSEANLDDGSCNYPGCTDSEACNYDETAGCDDDSCVFPPLVELGSNTTLCEGESLELSVDAPGLTITWNTGATGSNLTITESGTYSMETDISISDSHSASTAIEFGPSNPGLVASASGGMNVYDEGEVTLASWVYASDQPGSQRIIALTDNGSVYQQYAMSIEGQGRLYFLSGTSEFEANGLNLSFSAIPIDEWAHVAVTVKSDGVRMYINGILDRFNPVQDQFPTSWTSDFSIGMRSDGAEQFNGKLSQIAVWNRALGDVEIHELFECPVNPASPGFQALWLNGTNPDGTVIDESGNANNVAYGGTSEAGPTQSCLTPCSASDTITVNFIDCESLCGPGTTWDPILQSCVADTPDAAAAEDCSLFTLQQLSSGYLLQQGQLDLQDTLIIELQQQVDSLNALLNNCPVND